MWGAACCASHLRRAGVPRRRPLGDLTPRPRFPLPSNRKNGPFSHLGARNAGLMHALLRAASRTNGQGGHPQGRWLWRCRRSQDGGSAGRLATLPWLWVGAPSAPLGLCLPLCAMGMSAFHVHTAARLLPGHRGNWEALAPSSGVGFCPDSPAPDPKQVGRVVVFTCGGASRSLVVAGGELWTPTACESNVEKRGPSNHAQD